MQISFVKDKLVHTSFVKEKLMQATFVKFLKRDDGSGQIPADYFCKRQVGAG